MNRLPAYGKRLMQLRKTGQAPDCVYVVFDWNLAAAFHRVVTPDDLEIENLELSFLAGVDCTLAYRDKDAARVPALAQAILQVNPRILNALAVDLPQNFILKNIAGEILL